MAVVPTRRAGPVDEAAGAPPAGPHRKKSWRRRLFTGDLAVDLTCVGLATMGFNRWRVADYPISDFVFVAAASVIVLRLLTGRARTLAPAESRRSSVLILFGALIMLTAGTLSSFSAWDPLGSMGVVLRLGWLTLVWFWILRSVTTSRAIFERLLQAWRIALLSSAAIAALGQIGITSWTVANGENRQTAFFGHPNDLAGFLVAGLPIIVLALPRPATRSRTATLRQLAEIGLMGFGIAATGSMSAVLGAIAGGVATFTAIAVTRHPGRRRRRHPLFVMSMVAVAAIGLVLLSSSDVPVIARITRLGDSSSGVNTSVESRGLKDKYVTDRVDELLVVGIGLDPQSGGKVAPIPNASAKNQGSGVHNMYLKVLLESGLPALIGLWIIIGTTFRQVWRLMVNTRDDALHPITAALFGSLVTINVFAMFQPTLFHRFYWLPIALVGTLWARRREELRQTRLAELHRPPLASV
jgi:O-antigen ligase